MSVSSTTNRNYGLRGVGSTGWNADFNTNMGLIDADVNQVMDDIADVVTTVADTPETYIYTGTFNGPTGTVIALPKAVGAVIDYGAYAAATSRANPIGDIYLTKTTSQVTVHCSESNTGDTFCLTLCYKGTSNAYGASLYREWIVSPDASITDHSNASTQGSLAYILAQVSTSASNVRVLGNHTHPILDAMTIPANVQLCFDMGGVLDSSLSCVSASYKWTASGHGTAEYYLEAAAGGTPGINEPDGCFQNGVRMAKGIIGSLAIGEWVWGDIDGKGYSSLQVRLSDGTDPDTKAAGYVTASYRLDIAGPIQARRRQIFSKCSTVVLTGEPTVYPEYWGGGTSASDADNATAFAAATYALAPTAPAYYDSIASPTGGNGGRVRLAGGSYDLLEAPIFNKCAYVGDGQKGTVVVPTGTAYGFDIKEDIMGGDDGYNLCLANMIVDATANANNIDCLHSLDHFLYLWEIDNVTFNGNTSALQRAVYAKQTTGNGTYSGRFVLCSWHDFFATDAAWYMEAGTTKCNDHLFLYPQFSGFRCALKIEGSNNILMAPHANSTAYDPVSKLGAGGTDFIIDFGEGYSNNVVWFPYFDGSVNKITIRGGCLATSLGTYPMFFGNIDANQIFTYNTDQTYLVGTTTGTVQYVDSNTFTVKATDATAIFAAGRTVCLSCGADGYRLATVSASAFSTDTTVDLVETYLTSNLDWLAASGSGTNFKRSVIIGNASQYLNDVETGLLRIGQDDNYVSRGVVGTTAYDFASTPLAVTTTATLALSCPGITAGMKCLVNMTTNISGIILGNFIATADVITIQFGNISGSPITINTARTFRWSGMTGA